METPSRVSHAHHCMCLPDRTAYGDPQQSQPCQPLYWEGAASTYLTEQPMETPSRVSHAHHCIEKGQLVLTWQNSLWRPPAESATPTTVCAYLTEQPIETPSRVSHAHHCIEKGHLQCKDKGQNIYKKRWIFSDMESWQKCDSHSNNGIISTGIISTEFGTSACNNLMFSAEIISTEFDTTATDIIMFSKDKKVIQQMNDKVWLIIK